MRTRAYGVLGLALSLVVGSCGHDSGPVAPGLVGVRMRVLPTFASPVAVPPALEPARLQVRILTLSGTQVFDQTFEVVPGEVFDREVTVQVVEGEERLEILFSLFAAEAEEVWRALPDTIEVPEGEDPPPVDVSAVFQWVGPGAGAARLELTPAEIGLAAGDDTLLVATAYDEAGQAIEGAERAVEFETESGELGDFVDDGGRWQSAGVRGTTRVIARLAPLELADTSVIVIRATPSTLVKVAGDGQEAPRGTALPDPIVVRVVGDDQLPVERQEVLFLPQDGGSVGSGSVLTDDNGLAVTSWTLGPAEGAQSLRAEVAGRPEVFALFTAQAVIPAVAAPTNVRTTAYIEGTFEGFTVSWDSDDAAIQRFEVARSMDGGLTWNAVGTAGAADREFFDPGPQNGWTRDRRVEHRVRGCSDVCSGWTTSQEPGYTAPNRPGSLTVEIVGPDANGTILLAQWTDTNQFETAYDVCDVADPADACNYRSQSPDSEQLRFTTTVTADSVLVIVRARNPTSTASTAVWVRFNRVATLGIQLSGNKAGYVATESGIAPALDCERVLYPYEGVLRTEGTCAAEFPQGTEITLVTDGDLYTFGGWGQPECTDQSPADPCTFVLDGDRTVSTSLSYDYGPMQLAVLARGDGSGGVASQSQLVEPFECSLVNGDPVGCGYGDVFTYPPGTIAQMTASPASGSLFLGWAALNGGFYGDCGQKEVCEVVFGGRSDAEDYEEVLPRFSDLPGTFALGNNHTCYAMEHFQEVHCWGRNFVGQLGLGQSSISEPPTLLDGASLASVSGGPSDTSCGLDADGYAWCWGRNGNGQVGNGTTSEFVASPTRAETNETFIQIATGGVGPGYQGHTCAVTPQYVLFCWGSNSDGQLWLGEGQSGPTYPEITVDGGVRAVATGGRHTCVVVDDQYGSATYCWGLNDKHQLGDDSDLDHQYDPVEIAQDPGLVTLDAGYHHTCGIQRSSAAVYCWGWDTYGQVGDGPGDGGENARIPSLVLLEQPVTQVAAGAYHTCALTEAGEAWCWGYGGQGQLGNGSLSDSQSPVRVSGGHRFVSLDVGGDHSCGQSTDGTVYCWGKNEWGQLGDDGVETLSSVPVAVDFALR